MRAFGPSPRSLNLDTDADLELVVGTDGSAQLKYYDKHTSGIYVSKTGSANPFPEMRAAGTNQGLAPFFINLDSDADLELVVGDRVGHVRTWDKNTQGSYVEKTGTNNPFRGVYSHSDVTSPSLINFDADDDLELVLSTPSGGLFWYYDKDSDGAYQRVTGENNPFEGLSGIRGGAFFLDVDGNGNLELLLGSGPGLFYGIHYNNSDWVLFQ